MKGDEIFMRRAIELALHGEGLTPPNPMVGCVIVSQGVIIGEGYHHRYGGPHAEVVAIESVRDPASLRGATLYVTLEPCSHHGNTPPCADLIVEQGIGRVVMGSVDSNPLVAGRGISRLRDAGIETTTGVLSERCRQINAPFFTFHERKRPHIVLKWAETLDGFLDICREDDTTPHINWITDPMLKTLVHRWRAATGAILAGAHTVINDNPQLTTREWPGNNPIRIILDPQGMLDHSHKVFGREAETWLYTSGKKKMPNHVVIKQIAPDTTHLPETVLTDLYRHKVQSLIVEGGAHTLGSFIRKGLWDEARVFVGAKCFHKGVAAPHITGTVQEVIHLGVDTLTIITNKSPQYP